MQRVLTADETRRLEQESFRSNLTTAREAMERAGRAVADYVLSAEYDRKRVLVVAGGGNNGGDGFTAAAALASQGVAVRVAALRPIDELHGDALDAARGYLAAGGVMLDAAAFKHAVSQATLLIDALYGTGLRLPLPDDARRAIEELNGSGLPIIAIDLPSGVCADSGQVDPLAIRATATVALQYLKVGHTQFPGAQCCGSVYLADIGLIAASDSPCVMLEESDRGESLRPFFSPAADFHKGQKGHVLVVGGSAGHYGAPLLAVLGAFRTGAGLVTAAVPERSIAAFASRCPEAMSLAVEFDSRDRVTAESQHQLEQLIGTLRHGALALGMGIGTGAGSRDVVQAVLRKGKEAGLPVVVDADALNLLAGNADLRTLLTSQCVLTPHPHEMARLLDVTSDVVQRDRLGAAHRAAALFGCEVVLKGARTIIAGADGLAAINPASDSRLATAGSGDALSGVMAALLARSMTTREAARSAVFLHGAAAAHCPLNQGVMTSDLIALLPVALTRLLQAQAPAEGLLRLVLEALR